MPRPAWTLYAYQLIEPDDQLDLFACREVRVHVVARQLELDTPADRTLCGKLLPAQPRWQPLERARLRDRLLCPDCRKQLEAEKRGIRAAGGLEMLVAQAKYAVEIFLDTHLEDARIAEINTPLLKERSNLVLVGMSGGGKSTIGKRAAEKLGKGFVDTDELIIERIKMPIAEFFAKEGEPAFREIETKVIHEVSAQNNLVIATGGGIIKNPLNVEYLKRNGRLIWLKRDADLLQTGNGRPLAPDQAAAQKLYQERLPLYTATAEAIADNNGTLEEGLSAVLQCYESLLK